MAIAPPNSARPPTPVLPPEEPKVETPPVDTARELFQKHAKTHSLSSHLNFVWTGDFLPMFFALEDYLTSTASLASQKDPKFYEKILPGAKEGDVLREFFLRMADFKKTKDPQRLVELIFGFLSEIKKHEELQSRIPLIKSFIILLETNRVDLFHTPSSSFIFPDLFVEPQFKVRNAVSSSFALARSISWLNQILRDRQNATSIQILRKFHPELPDQFDLTSLIQKIRPGSRVHIMEYVKKEIIEIEKQVNSELKAKTSMTPAQRADILIIFQRLSNQLAYVHNSFHIALLPKHGGDLTTIYQAVLYSPECYRVGMLFKTESEITNAKFEDFDPHFVPNHQEVFRGFVPRNRELLDVYHQSSCEIVALCKLIKHFPHYVRLGKMDDLLRRLSNSKTDFDKIVHAEILHFAKTSPVDTSTSSLNMLENFFSEIPALIAATTEDRLEWTSQWETYLFTAAKPKPPQTQMLRSTPSGQGELDAIDPVQVIREGFKSLAKSCPGAGTRDSLTAAECHFEDLLCAIQRLIEQSKGNLGRQHIHAFVVECVRHGTHTIEQMLSALYLQSNDLSGPKELDEEFFFNNPYLILQFCRLKVFPFPSHFRELIRDANRGEIYARNLEQCRIDGSKVESLLAKMRFFVQGNDAFTADEVIATAFKFCVEMSAVAQETMRQITLSQPIPSQATDCQIFEPFSNFCARLPSFKTGPSPHKVDNEDLKSLRASVETLQKRSDSVEAKRRLRNVLNHLLYHLETEMQSQAHLTPLTAHLHLRNVLLLNQMIGQEVLSAACAMKEIPCTFNEAIDHDLYPLVENLKRKKEDD